jgi:hypothetical protein
VTSKFPHPSLRAFIRNNAFCADVGAGYMITAKDCGPRAQGGIEFQIWGI